MDIIVKQIVDGHQPVAIAFPHRMSSPLYGVFSVKWPVLMLSVWLLGCGVSGNGLYTSQGDWDQESAVDSCQVEVIKRSSTSH